MNAAPQNYLAKSPYCEHVLDPSTAVDGWVTCECGHKSDVRWVNELGWLQSRKDWVSQRITNSEPWFDSRKSSSAQPAKAHRPASGQQLLYILGGVSLVVAVLVFTAVAWERIGELGQFAALMSVVAVSSFVAVKSRDSLVGLSNTSAVLASFVAVTGLLSSPFFGLVGDPRSFYTPAILAFVVAISFGAGYLSKVPGWTLIAIIGLIPTSLVFTENYLNSNLLKSNYIALSAIALSFAAILAALMMVFSSKQHELNNLYKFAVTGVELLLVIFLYAKIVESIEPSPTPLLVGGTYLALSAIWMLGARKIPRDDSGFSKNAISEIAAYVSSALFGFAIPISLIPQVQATSNEFLYEPLPGSADFTVAAGVLVGAALMLAPTLGSIRNMHIHRYLTVAGAVTWYATNEISNRVIFTETISQTVTLFALTTISLALSVRWWVSKAVAFFIPAAIFGSIAVGFGVATFVAPSFEGPEAVTFSVAIYLWLFTNLLGRKTGEVHNSFIVWGIPLLVALVPSALYSNAMLFDANPDTMKWIRFWAVVAASVGTLVIGLKSQKSGLFIPGAIAFSIISLPQIFLRLSVYVPRWIVFGLIGILLITVAARFEHLQKLGRDTSRWFKQLN